LVDLLIAGEAEKEPQDPSAENGPQDEQSGKSHLEMTFGRCKKVRNSAIKIKSRAGSPGFLISFCTWNLL